MVDITSAEDQHNVFAQTLSLNFEIEALKTSAFKTPFNKKRDQVCRIIREVEANKKKTQSKTPESKPFESKKKPCRLFRDAFPRVNARKKLFDTLKNSESRLKKDRAGQLVAYEQVSKEPSLKEKIQRSSQHSAFRFRPEKQPFQESFNRTRSTSFTKKHLSTKKLPRNNSKTNQTFVTTPKKYSLNSIPEFVESVFDNSLKEGSLSPSNVFQRCKQRFAEAKAIQNNKLYDTLNKVNQQKQFTIKKQLEELNFKDKYSILKKILISRHRKLQKSISFQRLKRINHLKRQKELVKLLEKYLRAMYEVAPDQIRLFNIIYYLVNADHLISQNDVCEIEKELHTDEVDEMLTVIKNNLA